VWFNLLQQHHTARKGIWGYFGRAQDTTSTPQFSSALENSKGFGSYAQITKNGCHEHAVIAVDVRYDLSGLNNGHLLEFVHGKFRLL
jgi:hypothetical protein